MSCNPLLFVQPLRSGRASLSASPAPQYKLSARKQVRGKAARALAALQATGQEEAQLSLERDVLPKLEVCAVCSQLRQDRDGLRAALRPPERRPAVPACLPAQCAQRSPVHPTTVRCWRR